MQRTARGLSAKKRKGMGADMEELKKCSCGQMPRLRTYRTYNEKICGMVMKYYVECSCGAEVPELGYIEKEKAISEWNGVMQWQTRQSKI